MERYIKSVMSYIFFFAVSLLILFFIGTIEILDIGLRSGIRFSIFGIIDKNLMMNLFLYRIPVTLVMSLFFSWGFLNRNKIKDFFCWLFPLLMFFCILFCTYYFFDAKMLENPNSDFFEYINENKAKIPPHDYWVAKRPVEPPVAVLMGERFNMTINAHLLGAKGNGIWNLCALCLSLTLFISLFSLLTAITRWAFVNFFIGVLLFFLFFHSIKLILGNLLFVFKDYFRLAPLTTYETSILLFLVTLVIWICLLPFVIYKKRQEHQ